MNIKNIIKSVLVIAFLLVASFVVALVKTRAQTRVPEKDQNKPVAVTRGRSADNPSYIDPLAIGYINQFPVWQDISTGVSYFLTSRQSDEIRSNGGAIFITDPSSGMMLGTVWLVHTTDF